MKCCIVYLIRGNDSSLRQFERSLALLKRNFLPWSPAEVVVFHEDNLDPARLDGRSSGVPLQFLKVDFSGVPPALASVPVSSRGYRHMCHFFANDIFLRPELADYDYQMRLDDDSLILSPLEFNVFERMRERGYKYAYRAVIKDKPQVCAGLWPTAGAYFEKAGSVRPFADIRELAMYYTNFEICDLRWFRAAPWQDFFRAIDAAGGIWRYRWGDAPIRYLGVQGLLADNEIEQLCELDYFHQSRWRAGHRRRLAVDLIGYYLWVIGAIVRNRLS